MDFQLWRNFAYVLTGNAPRWENNIVLIEVIKQNEQYPINIFNGVDISWTIH